MEISRCLCALPGWKRMSAESETNFWNIPHGDNHEASVCLSYTFWWISIYTLWTIQINIRPLTLINIWRVLEHHWMSLLMPAVGDVLFVRFSVNLQTSLVWYEIVVGRFWCLREITQTPQSRKSSWNLFLSCGVLWIGAVGITFKYMGLVLLENTFSTVCGGWEQLPSNLWFSYFSQSSMVF